MADTIDKQFVEFIAKTLVEDPNSVEVEREIDERGVLLQLHVAPDDLGRVIGRGGSTAKSIRTLLRALSVKNDARYNLKIVDSSTGDDSNAGYVATDIGDDLEQSTEDSQEAEEVADTSTDDETSEKPAGEEEGDNDEVASDVVTRYRSDIDELKDDLENDE